MGDAGRPDIGKARAMSDVGRLIVKQIPHLRRYAWALVGDRAQVDDLVQDSLERAWSRLHLWQPGTNIRTWLFTIMHNLHANAARQRSRRPRLVPLEGEAARLAVRPSQEARVDFEAMGKALAGLPERQRAVVLLVGLEGLSYAEAASVLSIPLGTMMSRLHRGREQLRARLSGENPANAREDTREDT